MRTALLIVIPACAVLAACASNSAISRPNVSQTMRVAGAGASDIALSAAPTVNANSATVAFPLASVWRALPWVFDSLSIPIGTVDPTQHVIGNSGLKVRRRLGKSPLSRFIDCGTAQASPSADTYDVQLSVLTQAQPSDSGTMLSTTVDAVARPADMRGDYIHCSSNGVLEPLIVKTLTARLRR
jgi:hypothetical protein